MRPELAPPPPSSCRQGGHQAHLLPPHLLPPEELETQRAAVLHHSKEPAPNPHAFCKCQPTSWVQMSSQVGGVGKRQWRHGRLGLPEACRGGREGMLAGIGPAYSVSAWLHTAV